MQGKRDTGATRLDYLNFSTFFLAQALPPVVCHHRDQGGSLPDVINIRGVSFERWKQAGDGPSSSPAAAAAVGGGGGPESDERSEPEKMVLLYLPGIEGLGTSVEPQLPALSSKFDVFRLIIGAEDRSTFTTLSRAVSFYFSSSREAPLYSFQPS